MQLKYSLGKNTSKEVVVKDTEKDDTSKEVVVKDTEKDETSKEVVVKDTEKDATKTHRMRMNAAKRKSCKTIRSTLEWPRDGQNI